MKILTKILSLYNFPLTITRNGKEALDYLANPHNPRPDIFLLDVCLYLLSPPVTLSRDKLTKE